MPTQDLLVIALNWVRCWKAQKQLRIRILFHFEVHYHIHFEVLSNASYHWSESTVQLPVHSIIEHVEQHHWLISHTHIWITQQLNQQLLNPLQRVFVILNLSHKQCSLQLLHVLQLVYLLARSAQYIHKLLVSLFSEWIFKDISNNLLQTLSQSLQS